MTNSDLEEKEVEFGLPAIGIPGEILFNSFISDTQKILFGFIRSLSKKKRGCWATNATLANLIGCRKTSITPMISKLERFQYLTIINVPRKDNTIERRIYENQDYHKKYIPLVNAFHDDKNNSSLYLKSIIFGMVSNGTFPDVSLDEVKVDENFEKGGGPFEEMRGIIYKNDHIRIIDNDSDKDTLSKDNERGSAEPIQSSLKHRRTASERSPIKTKQISPKKEWIENDWKRIALNTWNKIPETFHHKDLTTKLICKASKWLEYLVKGIFFDHCKLNPDFIKRNKIPEQWIIEGKKFSHREILSAIQKYNLLFKDGYWPTEKKSLPRSLDTFIYNSQTGGSFLLRLMANSDIKTIAEENGKKDYNPQYTQYFKERNLLKHFSNGNLSQVYRGITSIEERVFRDQIFDFDVGNFKRGEIIGEGKGKLEPMFMNYSVYLNRQNRLEPEKMFSPYGYFQDFLEELKSYYSSFEVNI